MKTLFVSLVMPSLDYCCTVWGDRYKFHNVILNKCLKRAARIILKCPFLTPSSEMFAKLNWLSFSETVTYTKAVLVYKCINKMGPLFMTNLFTPLTQIRETRQSTDLALRVPFAKKESYSTSFAVKGAYIWNNLNAQLRAVNSLGSFKVELRKTFIR